MIFFGVWARHLQFVAHRCTHVIQSSDYIFTVRHKYALFHFTKKDHMLPLYMTFLSQLACYVGSTCLWVGSHIRRIYQISPPHFTMCTVNGVWFSNTRMTFFFYFFMFLYIYSRIINFPWFLHFTFTLNLKILFYFPLYNVFFFINSNITNFP